MSDQDLNATNGAHKDVPETPEGAPLTGEEVTLPGEVSDLTGIVGEAHSVTETAQVEPVHAGLTRENFSFRPLSSVSESSSTDEASPASVSSVPSADEPSVDGDAPVEAAPEADAFSSNAPFSAEDHAGEQAVESAPAKAAEPTAAAVFDASAAQATFASSLPTPAEDSAPTFEAPTSPAATPSLPSDALSAWGEKPADASASTAESTPASDDAAADAASSEAGIHTTTIPVMQALPSEDTRPASTGEQVPDALAQRMGGIEEVVEADPITAENALAQELEETSVRRRSLMTPVLPVEQESEATWKPREEAGERVVPQSTPENLDDVIFEGATVIPEIPSRAGAHWMSFLFSLLLVPVAWYLLADAGARMTLAESAPAVTGNLNYLALGELFGALVITVVLWFFYRRSSVGAWISGLLITCVAVPWVALPGATSGYATPLLRSLSNWNSLGANFAHHLQASAYSGRLLFVGVLLMLVGALSHSVRRKGRAEEALRAEVERVNPTGAYFTARARRRAEKAAGLR